VDSLFTSFGPPPLFFFYFLFFCINDLPVSINHISNVIIFAGDTSVLVTDDSYDNLKQKANLASSYLIKWFQANQI